MTENEGFMPKRVLQKINQIAADKEFKDKVSVLPFMCGTGKSTAISMKIREVIEANDGNGLLIVTDSVRRMYDYLEPKDGELKAFLDRHRNQITVMESDNVTSTYKEQAYRPVLIMSTQRYFHLSVEEINGLLTWKTNKIVQGTRPLVLIDEMPLLKDIISFNAQTLSHIGDAIQTYIAAGDEHASWWKRWGTYFNNVMASLDASFAGSNETKACIMRLQYSAELKEMLLKPAVPSISQATLDEQQHFLISHRQQLEKDPNSANICTMAEAVLQAFRTWMLVEHVGGKNYRNLMWVCLDNAAKVRDVNARVLILDGTGDIHAFYDGYDFIQIVDCSSFSRDLSRMTIKIVDVPTGKTSMFASSRKASGMARAGIACLSQSILHEHQAAIFTYKDAIKHFTKSAGQEDGYQFDYFGNLKGRNDYRQMNEVVQYGLNRFTNCFYYMLELIRKPQITAQAKPTSYRDVTDELSMSMQTSNSIASMSMNRMVLSDLEQNLFRGSIRDNQGTAPYTFYLFVEHKGYQKLINLIRNRYEPLGASVELIGTPHEFLTVKTCLRKNENELPRRFWTWYSQLPDGQEYTTAEIYCVLSTTKALWDQAKHKHPDIKMLLDKERVSRGRYKRK